MGSGLLLVLLAGIVLGQTGYRPANEFGEARFAIEAADFRGEQEETAVLEVYFKIFYDALSYQKIEDGYEALYEVSLVVDGKDDVQIHGEIKDSRIFVKTYSETRRSKDFVINLFSIPLEQQDVNIRASLIDKYAQTSREITRRIKRRDYWGKYPNVSRIEFAREFDTSSRNSKFNKGDFRVIPSVTRVYGGDNDSLLRFYVEVYPGRSKEKQVRLINRIYHKTKGFVYQDTIYYGVVDGIKRELHTVNVANMMPGDYELELRLEGRRGKVYNKLIEPFELELTAETMFRNDYKTAVKMLKYLGSREELKKLKKAKEPGERRHLWDKFWNFRNDIAGGRDNPTKKEYFRRVRHSNRYFSFMRKEGWKTGRGMVYISHGEPDEVEDYPFELATKPYQYWHYYRSTPPRRFLFIDEWGDGDYELQPPFNGLSF